MEVSSDTRDRVAQMAPGRNFDERLQNLMRAQSNGGVNRTRQTVISGVTESGRRVKFRETSPVDGFVNQVVFKFPQGLRGTVELAFEVDQERIVPSSGDLLSLNGALPSFRIDEEVNKGDELDLIVENRDPENDHKVTAVVTVIQDVEDI